MKFGRGTAWLLRWFAKPVVTGSIPAPASIFRRNYGVRLWGRAHRYQMGQSFAHWIYEHGDGPFASGMKQEIFKQRRIHVKDAHVSLRCPAEHLMEKHQALTEALTKLSILQEKYIAKSKALSELKRKR